MRYEQNQEIFAVNFTLDTLRQDYTYTQPYLYTQADVKKINFTKLVVESHHKVRGEFDEDTVEPKYDGYLLKDDKGLEFANQYPVAGYSQTSNEGDFRFFVHLPTKEDYEALVAKDKESILEYATLWHVVQRIRRGIMDLGDIKLAAPEDQKQRARDLRRRLIELNDRIITEFNQQYPSYLIKCELRQLVVGSELRHPRVKIVKSYSPDEAKDLDAVDVVRELAVKNEFDIKYPDGSALTLVRGIEVDGTTTYCVKFVEHKLLTPETVEKVIFFPLVSHEVVATTFLAFVRSVDVQQIFDANTLNEVVETFMPPSDKQ